MFVQQQLLLALWVQACSSSYKQGCRLQHPLRLLGSRAGGRCRQQQVQPPQHAAYLARPALQQQQQHCVPILQLSVQCQQWQELQQQQALHGLQSNNSSSTRWAGQQHSSSCSMRSQGPSRRPLLLLQQQSHRKRVTPLLFRQQ
jgi:hypothetical protein